MGKLNWIMFLVSAVLLNTGCFKKEDPWVLQPSPAQRITSSISLGSNYANVAFFDFATNSFKVRQLYEWDLMLEASPKGYRTLLNGGRSGLIYNTKQGDFGIQFTTTPLIPWQYDNPRWKIDSTAIGEWLDSGLTLGHIYIIDRGSETPSRYKKFQLQEVTETQYKIRHSDLNGGNEHTNIVYKNSSRNFTYFNFDKDVDLSAYEPANNEWDIQFTRYRHVFENSTPVIPYLVTGVLLNPNNVAVYKESTKTFDEIDLIYANSLNLSSKQDFIGYDWKTFNFQTETYTTNSDSTYIIRTHSGKMFKMRFVDFYDNAGQKGTPIFEFQEL